MNMSEGTADAKRQADALISGLGNTVGIPDVVFDADNRCCFTFDDHPVVINYDEDAGWLCLESPVLEVPSSPSAEFYPWVLEDNLTSFFNGIGCLAMDRTLGSILWLDRRPIKDMGQLDFENWLAKSIERAEFWAAHLRGRVNSAGSDGGSSIPRASESPEMVIRA